MTSAGLHEDFERDDDVTGPSDRRFGITIGIVLTLLAGWKGYHGSPWAYVWGGGAAVLIGLALTRPALLAPLNKAWLRLGLVLHRVVNPVIMALLFYGTIVPMGLLMRTLGKDPLRLKRDPGATSYWLPREETRPWSESMRQQF